MERRLDLVGRKIQFEIAGYPIQEFGDVFTIAEAGVNHNGKLDIALSLVDAAAGAGAKAVKFQTFKAEQVVNEYSEMAAYQKKNLGVQKTQREMLRELELPQEFYEPIIKRCKKQNILFLSTPHGGKESVDLLLSLGIEAFKVGSQDLTNYILLDRIARSGRPIILGTGMSTLQEIKDSVMFIRSRGNRKIVVMHCTTNYPCPPEEVNLSAMTTMMGELDVPVGYSDHSIGNRVAIMAATLGAAIYESHLTMDKSLPGPDHIASADPEELRDRMDSIKLVKTILGVSEKRPTLSESEGMISLVRKSIVTAERLRKGQKIEERHLEALRPASGVSPKYYEAFIGREVNKDLEKDSEIHFEDLED